ncbi:unnamed protein product [Trichobilharzia regenti]|nr:unnamed protein product [Trichobilharzia regenti]
MCFESDACRRTYLSQRDLQAHIDHRHRTGLTSGNGGVTVTTTANNNSNDNNNNNSNSNTNTSMSETIISVTSQQMNFSDGGTSLLPGGVKTTATPTNSHTVTTTIPMLDKITVSNAQMSLLGPSPRMIMNTMIPPNCTTTPPNIFINSQKSGGLLPLPPTQTTLPVAVSSSLLHSTRPPMPMPSAAGSSIGIMNRPAGINNPSVIGSNSSGGGNPIGPGNFPHLQSFANCPPPTMQPSSQPIGRPNMPLPQPAPPSTFLANSLPGGQLSSSTHNQNFNGASAVAALAAVVSAAMSAVQSKNTGGGSTGGIGGTNLPGGIQQQPLTNSQLQVCVICDVMCFRFFLSLINLLIRASVAQWL